LQNEQPELIETDLGRLPSPDEAHPGTVGRAVIGLLQRVGRSVEALRFAYTLLRRHFEDADANLFYLMLFFQCGHDGWPVNDLDCVGPDAAVCYREVGVDEDRWLVIEDDAPQEARDEFSSDHVRVTPMLGRRVGEQFLLAPGVQPRMGEVLRICSKFVYRFERCRDEYQTRFPDRQDFQIVRLVRPGSGNERELDLRPILESLDERRQFILEAANTYSTHPMPLYILCRMTGRDLFEVMDFLTSRPDIGIRAWVSGGVEAIATTQHLAQPQAIVLDLTAFFAIWRLDLVGLLESWEQIRLVVSQSTFDRLRDNAEAFAMSARHCRMFADGTGRYVWQETSEDVQEQLRDSMQRLVCFVRDRCEVLCCRELADFDPERREELLDTFGRDELESMCLAGREGHVLWTDDATVAVVAQEMFGSERCVWTQVLLRSAADRDLLGQIQFHENSARLIGYGYGTTWFTPETLYWAARMANWSYRRWPYHQALRYFRSEEVSARERQLMAAAFLALVFRVEWSSLTRWSVLGATLTSFADRRLVQSLGPYIDAVLGLNTADRMEMRQLLARWLRGGMRSLG
jgi:hypothetical protein